MKKRTLFAIVISIVFIVIGGIGTVVMQGKLFDERQKNAISKKIPTKENKELEISFTTATRVMIERSEDSNIYLDKEGTNFKLDKNKKADCTFTEEKDKSTLVINNPSTKENTANSFFFIYVGNYLDDSVRLRIPSHYETININGEFIDLSMFDIAIDTLNFDISDGSISLTDIKANRITQEKNDSDFIIDESKIQEELSVASSQYNISVLNTTAKKINLTTDMGDITTGNTTGDLFVTSKDGNISVNHTTGKSTIETKHGDILFHDDNIDNETLLTSTTGDIDIETDKASIDNNELDFETKLGDISIFNKNLSSNNKYKTNKGKTRIKAISNHGDIEVEELESDDTHYGYD